MSVQPQLDLDARYGRDPGSRRRVRIIAIVAAVALAAALGAWLWWGGLLEPKAHIQSQDMAFELTAPDSVNVTWRLTVTPGTPASCAVQALNSSFAIVGWRIVDIPPGEVTDRVLTADVRTAEPAVTGLIYRCWIPGPSGAESSDPS